MSGAYRSADATVSARGATVVTVSDSTVFPVCRGLWVGSGGDLVVQMADPQTVVTFKNVGTGILPIQVDKILATGTTAANILALY